jgi:succinate dehydrogenase/fumarate reductase flavoprotein subunit
MKTDVIVVGGGLAGILAVYGAQSEGAKVTLIDRGSIGIGTNSALAGGLFSSPTSSYGAEEYVRDTLEIGRTINRESAVHVLANEAPKAFEFLRSLGLNVTESQKIYYSVQSPRPEILPGMIMMKRLAQAVRELRNTHMLTGFYVTEIIKDGNKVCGVKGFDKTGKELSIYAPAVVLAAGGAGGVYLRNDNQRNMLGQGYHLAARAGLDLWDMEFVQFIPIVMAEPHLPTWLLQSPFPQEAKLIDASGKDVLQKFGIDNLNYAVRNRRDELSILLFEEGRNGPVFMDYRNVPASAWEVRPLSLLKRIKFDFRTKPVTISPAAHFCMGGVETDDDGQTSLPGLFASGEVAWGVHGANRRGGNALTECMVFGRLSGYNAARYALVNPLSSVRTNAVRADSEAADSTPSLLLRKLLQRVREIAWDHTGVVRSESGLKEGLIKIEEAIGGVRRTNYGSLPARVLREDLVSACFVVKAVLTASLAREESRGSFYRKDFASQDDVNWRRNSCLQYNSKEGTFALASRTPDG